MSGIAASRTTGREAITWTSERFRRFEGFTLIELLIVMSLIVILAGIGLAVHANSQTRAREAVLKEDLFRMRDAIDQYYADKNAYPPSLEALFQRLRSRATETANELEIRQRNAAIELARQGDYDQVVVNETDQVDRTAAEIEAIIAQEKKRNADRQIRIG